MAANGNNTEKFIYCVGQIEIIFGFIMVVYGIKKKAFLTQKPSYHITYLECPMGPIEGHLKAYPH